MNLYEEALTELQKRKRNNIGETDYEITKDLLQQAIKNIENVNYFFALTSLIEIYNRNKLECVINFIFQSYVIPNKDYFNKNYQKNVNLLNKYEHYYGKNLSEKNEFKYEIIWVNKQHLVLFDGSRFIKKDFLHNDTSSLGDNDIPLYTNELNYKSIITWDEKIPLNRINEEGTPIYLYYEQDYFEVGLRIFDFQELLKKRRLVIFCGKQYLKGFFEHYQAIFPSKIFEESCNEIKEILENIYYKKREIFREAKEKKEKYYKENTNIIIDNIKKGNPKILFITSLFTTALQYHAKNMEKAARKIGCQTELLIEKSEIHRMFIEALIININEFRPDIVFILDHFRYEHDYLDEAIVVVTWIQDPLSNIMNKDTPLKLGNRDFILNHFITWKPFFEIGYNRKYLIDGAIPANQNIYKTYNLSEAEKLEYSADICILCHTYPLNYYIDNEISYIKDEDINNKIKEVFYSYYNLVYNDFDMIFYDKQEFVEFIDQYFIAIYDLKLNEKLVDFYAERMHQELNNIIFRHCLVDCLIEAGYTNIKLWGNGWRKEEKYAAYAMGAAENGEKLSKIYQCSKIVIGHNLMTTAAARAWESIFSGTLYLCNWIPPEADATDIRTILEPEDFVMFKGKEDLLTKVKYYLENEEERQKMIMKEKDSALKKMTFEATCQRMLDALKERL